MKAIAPYRVADIERTLAQVKTEGAWTRSEAEEALSRLADSQRAAAVRLVGAHDLPAVVADLAARRAAHMMDVVAGAPVLDCPEFLRNWLQAQVNPLQGGRLRIARGASVEQSRRGLVGRVTCKDWWRKALTKAATLAREHEGREKGRVWAGRQQYITDETMRRKLNRDAQNAAMLERTELENEDGQIYTLADLAAVSVSNPAIRRGELMTRIRGCEEWAEAHGMAGVFTTQTAPGRFHAVHRHGGVNEEWIKAGKPTPKHAQQWLRDAWACARAELDRGGVSFFGFRVAEPHHDGTPHWHGLFWCKPEDMERLTGTIRKHWLKDDGQAVGAQAHRVKFKALERGGAAGYIAKYIAKGIDDAGAVGLEGHDDDVQGRMVRMDQGDMFGGGAARVRAWASAHGIRQFQPIGQPPVTVWRELRRVPKAQADAASPRIQAMHASVQRTDEAGASFAAYMVRQGGPLVGRDYRVALQKEERPQVGRYEDTTQARPVGVVDRIAGAVAYSNRKEWRPRGAWEQARKSALPAKGADRPDGIRAAGGNPATYARAVPPWTRVNNCTGQGAQRPPVTGKKLVLDWWEAFPPEVVADIRAKQAEREGRSHTDQGGGQPPGRVSSPPLGSHVATYAGGSLHDGTHNGNQGHGRF